MDVRACEASPEKPTIEVSGTGVQASNQQDYYIVEIPEQGEIEVQIEGKGQTPCPTNEEKCKCEDKKQDPKKKGEPKFTFTHPSEATQKPTNGTMIKWKVNSSTTPGEYKFTLIKIEQEYEGCPEGWTGGVESKSNIQGAEVTILAIKVQCVDFNFANGQHALKVCLLPDSLVGNLNISLKTDQITGEIFNDNQSGGDSVRPELNFNKMPNLTNNDNAANLQEVIAKWKIKGITIDSILAISGKYCGKMECTGYFTTCNSKYSGDLGTMYEGSTAISVYQAFLNANVDYYNGKVRVLEGVGVLTNGSETYYHFSARDQVVSNGHIVKYIVTSNDHDGDCSGGHQLQKNVSVAKKNSSKFFSCGDNVYIDSVGARIVEDNGHVIDTPDVFNGQGNSSLDFGYGIQAVFIP